MIGIIPVSVYLNTDTMSSAQVLLFYLFTAGPSYTNHRSKTHHDDLTQEIHGCLLATGLVYEPGTS